MTTDRRVAACVAACEGLNTEALNVRVTTPDALSVIATVIALSSSAKRALMTVSSARRKSVTLPVVGARHMR